MSALLSTVVMTTAALSSYHLDGDAQGRATLAWTGYARDRLVVRVADIRAGRPGPVTELWSAGERENVSLESLDVSPAGAAVACLRTSSDAAPPWRLRVVRRPPGGAWGKPILVKARGISDLTCATDDAGQVTLAWGLGGPVKTLTITPDGLQQGPVKLSNDAIGSPQVVVSAAGAATIAYTVGRRFRALHVAELGPGGWTTRAVHPPSHPSWRSTAAAARWSAGRRGARPRSSCASRARRRSRRRR